MQNIGEQLGYGALEDFRPHPALVTTDAVGVELELEGFTNGDIEIARAHLNPLWTITSDGSLRNGGVEFITTGGKGGETLHQAYERITSCLRDRVNYDASWRCSTHMHINMLDFTVNQAARFMLVYAACEPVLFEMAGSLRRSSNFCTPLADSLNFHRRLIARLYDDTVANRGAAGNCSKYTALNYQPLFGNERQRPLGTIEFRGGRPMTTMQELLLQTNLLLSIKQFVREFKGTEEEMLTKLGEGVFNTVYANGCAASLDNIRVEDLELALIHSWLLLKSYQQGIQERASAPQRGANPFGHNLDWSTVTPPRRMSGTAIQGGAEAPAAVDNRPFWSATTITRGMDYRNRTFSSPNFSTRMDTEHWPRLHQHLAALQNPSTTRATQVELIVNVLTDPAFQFRCSRAEATKVALNWVLRGMNNGEGNPLGTIIRAALSRCNAHENNVEPPVECLDSSCRTANQPLNYTTSVNVDYVGTFPEALKTIVSELMGCPRALFSNVHLWQHFMCSTVMLTNKQTLINAFCQRTGAAQFETCPDVISPAQAYYLFRICNVRSEDHITPDFLPTYDRTVAIMQHIIAQGMVFPVCFHTISSVTRTPQRRVYTIGTRTAVIGYNARSHNVATHQTHAPRVSATTGQRIY